MNDPMVWYWLTHGLLIILLIVCAATDLILSKIYNAVTVPSMVLGIGLNGIGDLITGQGFGGFKTSIIGCILGFGVFLLIFMFGGMGGGDVKLMGAIGALGGYPFIVWAMFFSALSGGLIAMIAMIYHGQLLNSLRNVLRVFYTFVMPHKVTEPLSPENSSKVPFGFGISIGTLWCWVLYFLGKI